MTGINVNAIPDLGISRNIVECKFAQEYEDANDKAYKQKHSGM